MQDGLGIHYWYFKKSPMLTFSKFGKKGRLGNQLFHLAGMIGFAKKFDQPLKMPAWMYMRYFNPNEYVKEGQAPIRMQRRIEEDQFHYVEDYWRELSSGDWDVSAWLQSEKYWEHCKDEIKRVFTWESNYEAGVIKKIPVDFTNAIAISVRRGDYVKNENYDLLPVSYYMQALMKEFPDFLDRQIMIFSDDIPYCKLHFEGLPNVWYADALSDIAQLCVLSHCNNFIIANSTFSWWGAYLAELRNPDAKIVRPNYLFAGPLLKKSDSKDHWPDRWTVYDHKEGGVAKKYDLKDVTFTVPLTFDHMDRRQNAELNICLIQRVFDTNVMIMEALTDHFGYMAQYSEYYKVDYEFFHRTRMLNDMAWLAKTPFVANWDADVAVPEVQILVAVEWLRRDLADGVYPYDGRFARVPRADWFKQLEKELDLGIYKNTGFKGTRGHVDRSSVGGAVIWNKQKFFEGGGENENFKSYAPEDAERWDRFHLLGFRIARVKGQLYHMDHFIGPNSKSSGHGFKEHNHQYYHEFKSYTTAEELWAHVRSWPWFTNGFSGEPQTGSTLHIGTGGPITADSINEFIDSQL
jgi:hypothetical protein